MIRYGDLLTELVKEHRRLARQKDEIEVELSRIARLTREVVKMLPEKERTHTEPKIDKMIGRSLRLGDAVRMALRSHPGKWMEAPNIRDYLKEIGFDFTDYKGSPLTSIHSVVKRMYPTEVDVNRSGDQVSYRWKGE